MESYSTQKTERDAVRQVEALLERCKLVIAEIPKNDRTPSWDGEIQLYTNEDLKKSHLRGRIPVQVKGIHVNKFSSSFSFNRADLHNYFHDRGAMVFVVEFKTRDDFRIYYRSLLPFDLKQILSDSKNHKTKSVKLEVLSGRPEQELLQILSAFIENREAQGTLLEGIGSLSDLQSAPIQIRSMSFVPPSIGIESREDAFQYFLSHLQYVYVTPIGIDSKFPVDIITLTKIAAAQKASITVNGEVIFDRITVIHNVHEKITLSLSPCLSFSMNRSNQISFQINSNGTLDDQIASLTFLIALLEKQDVKIDGRSFTFQGVRFDSSSYDEMKTRLGWLLDVRQTLNQLHVKKNLNMDMMTAAQSDCLVALVNGILYGKPVSLSGAGNSCIGRLSIGNITIALLLQKMSNGTRISDAYQMPNTTISRPVPGGGEASFPGSAYTILTADILLQDDNIDFDHMVDAITAFPYSEHYGTNITFFILELLHAYDRSDSPSDQLLDIALKLYEYLLKHDSSADMITLCYVNSLQVVKRRRALTAEENQYLLSLKSAFDTPLPFRLAASILLESFNEASLLFQQLDETGQTEFSKFPICHLWPRKVAKMEDT